MRRTRVSDSLNLKVQLLGGGHAAAQRRFWNHPRVVELFPSFLFRIHCEARASVHLMKTAVCRLEQVAEVDPLAPGLLEYLNEHIPQEAGHDDWVLESLEVLGIPREEVRARIPPPTIAALVGAQYYWIFHHHPVALLGYIKVLENATTTVEQIEQTAARTGLPLAAFRLHLGHARLEPRHQGELDLLLDSLPLSPAQESLIGISAARTLHHVELGLDELITLFESDSAEPVPTLF